MIDVRSINRPRDQSALIQIDRSIDRSRFFAFFGGEIDGLGFHLESGRSFSREIGKRRRRRETRDEKILSASRGYYTTTRRSYHRVSSPPCPRRRVLPPPPRGDVRLPNDLVAIDVSVSARRDEQVRSRSSPSSTRWRSPPACWRSPAASRGRRRFRCAAGRRTSRCASPPPPPWCVRPRTARAPADRLRSRILWSACWRSTAPPAPRGSGSSRRQHHLGAAARLA